jgi:ATP-binding cassette subfamily F protein uup
MERLRALRVAPPKEKKEKPRQETVKAGLSYKEKIELENLVNEIALLEEEKGRVESALSSGTVAPDELHRLSIRIGEVIGLLDEKELRWLELSEKEG